ncbi:peptide-methionine (S)-S-oxide reductase MsrA [Cohnella thailandensis]|uniref:Peptide methionine sulfoxide reductase MsrA n=1 Tax=Cohnella thailandensis TaxID=557557 RepID=A0A841T717_9BACL|nr:peptide-methionine (S)-S-oxide reductase MsrA [Cohnella thailandensis]MBB6636961.1 peptide-methionine (S)-S-oxide reductase MsrA [Cohnella thailandensis]MBP1973156.1 peptide methionine sulfoxide reductase msrA/msrB [Cohnella thailandensis]
MINDINNREELATFAGGCFWCMVKPFEEWPGIRSVVSGYTGGHTDNPTYEEVGRETTGHAEAVQIAYDPEIFPYERLLEIYWQLIDPTDAGGQFYDRGASYRTAIFYHTDEQRRLAEASKKALKTSGRFKKPIVTEILPAETFYPAEEEHQRYYRKNPYEYKLYMEGSGREAFAERHWRTKADRENLRKRLTERQYEATQHRIFAQGGHSAGEAEADAGLYVDVVNGDPLFSAEDRIAADAYGLSFRKPVAEGYIRREAEISGGRARTAIIGRLSGAFIGYEELLPEEKAGEDGNRRFYRINPDSVRFVPIDSSKKEE